MHVLPSNYTLIKDSIYCVQLFRIFFFFLINFFKFCNVKCTVPNRNILTPKQTPKYDQGSPLCLVGVYFLKTNDLQLLQSAMGLLGVSSWGQLCALKCEADPIFFLVACKPAPCIFQTTYMCIYTICPLHIPNKHVEIIIISTCLFGISLRYMVIFQQRLRVYLCVCSGVIADLKPLEDIKSSSGIWSAFCQVWSSRYCFFYKLEMLEYFNVFLLQSQGNNLQK